MTTLYIYSMYINMKFTSTTHGKSWGKGIERGVRGVFGREAVTPKLVLPITGPLIAATTGAPSSGDQD